MSLIGYSKSVVIAMDTDLAETLRVAEDEHIVIPAKGAISTIDTIVTGTGYSLGLGGNPKEGIVCTVSATTGTGTGAKFLITSGEALGAVNTNTVIQLTAGFSNFQNTLLENYNVASSDYTYVRDTATGANTVSGTTTAVVGTSTTGASATFLVTVSSGTITNVQQSGVAGTGYKVGDVVTIPIANLQAPMNVINGGGTVILSDLTLLLTEENVTGGLNHVVSIIANGSGYAVSETLTLQEEGSTNIGTATIDVLTLGGSDTVGEAISRYPQGVMFTQSGFTQTAPGTVELKQMDDTQVLIGGMLTGDILPMQFKEVTAAGTTSEDGITVFYSGS